MTQQNQPSSEHQELAFQPARLTTGYIPSVFVYFPLPYQDPGQRFSKSVRGYHIDLSSRIGCPYGKIGRSILCLITTEAVKTHSPHIELGSLRHTLSRMSFPSQGSYGNQTTEQFHRFANTHIDLDRQVNSPSVKGFDEIHFSFASALSLRWSIDPEHPRLPLSLQRNFLELADDCFSYIVGHSIPFLLEPYFSIRSPRKQDLYTWLGRRLWNLADECLVPWELLYEQFGPVTYRKRPNFRSELRTHLYEIKTDIYPAANVSATEEGLILKKSPPLVEPDDKKAGRFI